MNLTLYWWHIPVAIALIGVALLCMTRSEGGYFPMPSWHFAAGFLCILASICIAIGGLLS